MASEKWRSMGETERAPYEQRALVEKQRYESQMSMYVPAPGFSSKGSRKRVILVNLTLFKVMLYRYNLNMNIFTQQCHKIIVGLLCFFL